MPPSFERSWRLGRTPALTIAQWISRETKIRIETDLLLLKDSSSKKLRQAQLGLERRIQTPSNIVASDLAIRLAFARRFHTVLLVDDFMTSGHTLRNAALALKDAGFPIAHAIVLGYRPRQIVGEGDSVGSSDDGTLISSPAALSAVST